MGMNRSSRTILIFVITAAWDLILRWMAEGRLHLFGIEDMKWVRVLTPYFEEHTPLAAALIAGFVGACTYPLIVHTNPFSEHRVLMSTVWVALVSGLVGIPMRYSGLFPHLKKYYYDELGPTYSFMTDAMSGVVVAGTYVTIMRRAT